jgi:hypothetical protein
MESRIAEAVRLKIPPVGLLWADEKPDRAMSFQEGKWGCVMWLVAAAAKGRAAACDVRTFGCFGGGVGLGFGNQYRNFPGGEEGFCHFLSSGNADREGGKEMAEQVRPFLRDEAFDHFLHGEGYVRDPEGVRRFIAALPMREIRPGTSCSNPWRMWTPNGTTSGPSSLRRSGPALRARCPANYGRGDNENVIIPYAAGCQTVGIYPTGRPSPPVPGPSSVSRTLRPPLPRASSGRPLTFAVPKALFEEMESNWKGSFLERSTWQGSWKNRSDLFFMLQCKNKSDLFSPGIIVLEFPPPFLYAEPVGFPC